MEVPHVRYLLTSEGHPLISEGHSVNAEAMKLHALRVSTLNREIQNHWFRGDTFY